MDAPSHIHLDRRNGLRVDWGDGHSSHYSIAHLRRWSPSAEARAARAELAVNPLKVLPESSQSVETLEADSIERVGTYAVRITFNDGHRTGLYTWDWLRRIDPSTMSGDPS